MQRQIRVCHMTSAHESTDIRIFQKECVSLAQTRKFDVYLVSKGSSREEKNVHVIGLGTSSGRIMRMFTFSKKVYKEALSIDADIYHFHDPELLPYARKLKKKGKIVFFDSHEDTSQQIMIKEYIPKALRKIISKLYYNYETKICMEIDGVIFPCPVNGRHPFAGRANKQIYINNYPIIEQEYNEKNVNKAKSCYVGSLSEKRGVTTLLEAYKKFNDVATLVIAGKFETEEYKCFLDKNGLLESVDYRGICNREQVNQIYKESIIGISNLHNVGQYPKLDTFPTKVYEYMSQGLAVIVSDYPYSRKVIEKEKVGFCADPENPEDIARVVRILLSDRNNLLRMGKRGAELVKNYFNWYKEYEKLEFLYNETLNN